MAALDFPRPTGADVIAGASVSLVLIPQSLAYAELAGLPPYIGLFAASFPLLIFALFASSPYLQTGPVAVTSLLTLAAIPEVAAADLPRLAALLALMVGVLRVVIGAARLGNVVGLMSSPVVMGFTTGAAVVIISSQLPKTLGVIAPDSNVLSELWWTIRNPGEWSVTALALSIATVVLFLGGRKISPLFPGVLIAVVAAIVWSSATGYEGPQVDAVPEGLPPFSLDLPWGEIPTLLLGAIVIALVGFAEPASIARTFADETGQRWSANREMFASGLANLVASSVGAYPVGGSFSRSSVNRLAGAQTRWSGGVTGLIVIAFLPFATLLEPLPTAVLGAIVCAAVSKLIKPRALLNLWSRSRSQALLAYATAAATIVFSPRIERAVILGIVLTFVLHRAQRLSMPQERNGDGVVLRPSGLLWVLSAPAFEAGLRAAAAACDGAVVVDFARVPFLDGTTADALTEVGRELAVDDRQLVWREAPDSAERLLAGVATAVRQASG